jgi:hypothetical protein
MRSIIMNTTCLTVASLALSIAPASMAMQATTPAPAPAPAAAPATPPVPGQTVIVKLSSGDSVRAKLLSETADSVVVEHPVLGKVTIARTGVAAMSVAPPPPPPTAPADGAVDMTRLRQEAQPAANADMDAPRPQGSVDPGKNAAAGAGAAAVPAPPPPPPSPWKLLFDGNVNYVSAANKQLDFRIAASAIYEVKDVDKWANNVEYFYKVVDSGTTDNNLLATSTYDKRFEFNTRFLWFAKVQGQLAPLESYEQRLSGWGGVGYEFLKAPPASLIGKIGAGYTYEWGTINAGEAQLYAELIWDWKITDNQAIAGSFWITPDFADFTNYMFLFRTEWTMKMPDIKGLSLLGGIRWQYQSVVEPANALQNDIRLYAGLRYEM